MLGEIDRHSLFARMEWPEKKELYVASPRHGLVYKRV
jgi:hypothetical protein